MSDLREIPGVGRETEIDLLELGIDAVDQLVGENPEVLFDRLTVQQGGYTDRCNLYVYRCAVYYAEGGRDRELLKWWNLEGLDQPAARASALLRRLSTAGASQALQSSTLRSSIRSNSRRFAVTTVIPRAKAMAAMKRSRSPIG